jgi:hypothetical protein
VDYPRAEDALQLVLGLEPSQIHAEERAPGSVGAIANRRAADAEVRGTATSTSGVATAGGGAPEGVRDSRSPTPRRRHPGAYTRPLISST